MQLQFTRTIRPLLSVLLILLLHSPALLIAQNNSSLNKADSTLYSIYNEINVLAEQIKKFRVDPSLTRYQNIDRNVLSIQTALDSNLNYYTTLKKQSLFNVYLRIYNGLETYALANEDPVAWTVRLLPWLRNFQLEISQIPGIQNEILHNDTLVSFINPDWLDIGFKNDTIIYESGKFAFNILTISNWNKASKDLTIQYHFPTGFNTLSKPMQTVQLIPDETKNIPIRLQNNNETLSSLTKYNVVVSLIDNKTGVKIAQANYTIIPEKKRDWKARLINTDQFFTVGVKTVPFSINLKNGGTVIETINFSFIDNNSLSVINTPDSIQLIPGSDTTLTFVAKLPVGYQNSVRPYVVGIKLQSEKKSYTFNQKIIPVGQSIKLNRTPFRTFKGFVELSAQNINKKNKLYFLNTQGSMALPKNRSIFYSYRNNYITTESGNQTGSLFNVNYNSRRFKLFLGDQNELYNSIVTGIGVKTNFFIGDNDFVEIIGLKHRKLNVLSSGVKHQRNFNENTILNSTFEYKDDKENSLRHSIYTGKLSHNFSDSLRTYIEVGYGSENQNNDSIPKPLGVGGFHGAANAEWVNKKGEGNLSLNASNRDFPGFTQGAKSLRANYKYRVNNLLFGPRIRVINNQRQNIVTDSLRLENQFLTRDYEFDIQHKFKPALITVTPGYVYEKQDSINTYVQKLKLSGNIKFNEIGVSLLAYYGIAQYPDYNQKTQRTSINFSSSYKNAGLNIRYKKGPFFTSESSAYLSSGIINSSIAFLPYYNWFSKSGKIWVTTTGEARKENKSWQYLIRNSVSFQMKYGFSARAYASYRVNNMNEDDVILNLAVRKNISVPVPFVREFSKLKILLYKDINTNGSYESETDEPISNATIKIGKHYLQTDSAGVGEIKNIQKDIYPVDLSMVPNLKGWISGLGNFHNVAVGKKTKVHEVPFIKAKMITGEIVIDKDKYSAYRFDLSNIRVTATDSLGNTYSTFTNQNAQFVLNVPTGEYIVSFNEALFVEQFRVVNNKIPVNLSEAESYNIAFKVTEKRRKVNIRR